MTPAKAPPPTSSDELEQFYHAHFALSYTEPAAAADLIVRALGELGCDPEPRLEAKLAPFLAPAMGDPRFREPLDRLAAATARRGIEDDFVRYQRDRALTRHADFVAAVNDRGDGRKVVVFVAKSPYFVILREAIYLRRNGYRAYLLSLYPLAEDLRLLFQDSMDGIACVDGGHFALREVMRALRPDVFHVQCWQLSYEVGRMAIDLGTGAAVVCDFYDISSIYARRDALCTVWAPEVVDADHALERHILHNASGVISRYPLEAMENWGRFHGNLPPALSMQAYALPEFVAPPNPAKPSAHDGQIRLVYAGGLVPVWLNPELFPEVYMPATFQKLLDQGLAIDVLHDPHRPLDGNPVYAPFLELQRRYPKFRLVDGVPPDRLPAVLSHYDYGMLLTDFPDRIAINDDQKNGVVATKIYAYLEGGIPFVINAEYTEMARIAEEYGVGIAVHTRSIGRLKETLEAHDRDRAHRRIAEFNKVFSMDRQIHRLIDLYERAAAHRPSATAEAAEERHRARQGGTERMRKALHDLFLVLADRAETDGRPDDALACCEQALALGCADAAAWERLGRLMEGFGRGDRAIVCYREAVRLAPESLGVHAHLLACEARYGDLEGAALAAEAQRFGRKCATTPLRNPRRPRRVGFLAAGLTRAVRETLLAPFLTGHDRDRIAAFCYVGTSDDPAADAELRGEALRWTDVVGSSSEALADAVAADGVEVLVDLLGHSGANRLPDFARRLAPVQALWTTMPIPTGVQAVDFVIADRFLVPYGREEHFTETVVRLPGLAWCYRPRDGIPEFGPPPAAERGSLVFGSTTGIANVTAEAVDAWGAILTRLPGSQLWLSHDARRQVPLKVDLIGRFARVGVGPGRLHFFDGDATGAPGFDPGACDLLLDTFPRGGGIANCAALWRGLPVIARRDESLCGRIAAGIAAAIGCEGLAGAGTAGYVEAAVRLAGDLDRLAGLRAELRWRMADSPVCDRRAFARNAEAVLGRLQVC